MAFGAIGEMLDQGRPAARARAADEDFHIYGDGPVPPGCMPIIVMMFALMIIFFIIIGFN